MKKQKISAHELRYNTQKKRKTKKFGRKNTIDKPFSDHLSSDVINRVSHEIAKKNIHCKFIDPKNKKKKAREKNSSTRTEKKRLPTTSNLI